MIIVTGGAGFIGSNIGRCGPELRLRPLGREGFQVASHPVSEAFHALREGVDEELAVVQEPVLYVHRGGRVDVLADPGLWLPAVARPLLHH